MCGGKGTIGRSEIKSTKITMVTISAVVFHLSFFLAKIYSKNGLTKCVTLHHTIYLKYITEYSSILSSCQLIKKFREGPEKNLVHVGLVNPKIEVFLFKKKETEMLKKKIIVQGWLYGVGKEKRYVRSGIRTHAYISRLRPERSALDRSAILTTCRSCRTIPIY